MSFISYSLKEVFPFAELANGAVTTQFLLLKEVGKFEEQSE